MSNTTDKVSGKAEAMYGKVTHQKKHELKGKLKTTKADLKAKMDEVGKKLSS